MSKKNQTLYAVAALVVVAAVLVGYFALRDTGTDSDSFEVGFFVMDHMVSEMELVRDDLARRGFVEGENITYHVWMFEQEDLPDASAVADFDILMVLEAGDNEEEPLGRAFELVNNEIPIVFFADNTFPLDGGYVENLTRPGKNVTGVMETVADGKRFELFVGMVPDARRILVPHDGSEPDVADALEELQRLAEPFNVELIPVPMDAFEAYVAEYSGDVDAIFNLRVHDIIVEVIDFSQAQQLPVSADGTNVEILGLADTNYFLMEYYGDEASMSIQAASIAEQILNGADPGEIRVENSTSLLIINLVVADRLGIEISDSMLEQADEIIRP